jgi:hypothetical protein
MATTWTNVCIDNRRQDQLTTTAQLNDQQIVQSVTQQRVQTYMCVADITGPQPPLADALIASLGGVAIPQTGLVYVVEGQAGYTCTQSYPRRTAESPFVIEVQITFNRKFAVPPPDSTNWNIKITITGSKVTEPAYTGYNTDTSVTEPVTNSALESFDPPENKTWYDEQINLSYNTLSPPEFKGLRGHTNSDNVSFSIQSVSRSYMPNQLILDEASISASLTLSDMSTTVWAVSCTLFARDGVDSNGNPNTFTRNILDQSYHTLASGKRTVILDDTTNMPMNAPVMLDGMGGKLASGGTPVYRHYNIEDQAALSSVFDGLA